MLSIGWVIFWKCVVIGAWAGIVERWAAFRRKRREQGIRLKQNRSGVYVVSDWTVQVDRGLFWAKQAAFALVFIWWTVLGGTFVIGGRESARSLVMWLFF